MVGSVVAGLRARELAGAVCSGAAVQVVVAEQREQTEQTDFQELLHFRATLYRARLEQAEQQAPMVVVAVVAVVAVEGSKMVMMI